MGHSAAFRDGTGVGTTHNIWIRMLVFGWKVKDAPQNQVQRGHFSPTAWPQGPLTGFCPKFPHCLLSLGPTFPGAEWGDTPTLLTHRGSPPRGPIMARNSGCCRRAKSALTRDCSPVRLPNCVEGYLLGQRDLSQTAPSQAPQIPH